MVASSSSGSSSNTKVSSEKLKQLLATVRARKEAEAAASTGNSNTLVTTSVPSAPSPLQVAMESSSVTYNTEQKEFITLATGSKSCILIGAAGTGKTTCMKGTVQALIQSGAAGIYKNDGHKHLKSGTPGILILSYTRRAVNNIRKVLPDDLKSNAMTIHKALEYQPEYLEVEDPVTKEVKSKMQFVPMRSCINPISSTIKVVIVEEASMVDTLLFSKLLEALPHNPQFIFLGDIQQLPPVFGAAILGYKMLELPTVELTEVYRQALESPIIRLAHRILSGIEIKAADFAVWNETSKGKLVLHAWKKKLHPDIGLLTAAKFFTAALDAGSYDVDEDIILVPFNKAFGTEELNKHIAQHVSRKKGNCVYEIIAGYKKSYFSVGDKILYDKEDAEILEIVANTSYHGKRPQKESVSLDYWGCQQDMAVRNSSADSELNVSMDDFDLLISNAAAFIDTTQDEKFRASSHRMKIRLLDSDTEVWLDQAGDINNILLSYAITIHKSQGSEWKKVFLVLHQSHATMLQRELLYTAVTRAKEELYVICEPESFVNGIKSQRIKGNTLKEKAEYFKGKVEAA